MAQHIGTPDPAALLQRRQAENFPVALRVLPRRLREHLVAVYDFARVVDDLGDVDQGGDRLAKLDEFGADLATIWAGGETRSPVLVRLAGTVHACRLPQEPFQRLVEANRQDQKVFRYRSFEDLRRYCTLSADPVGRIVLGIFGATTEERIALSDQVCTGLQLVEHWQDVAEDRQAGRVYLPQEDLDRFGVSEPDLDAASAGAPLRRLLEFETERAEALLRGGSPLVGGLRGWARLAVAGYVAGGLAAADALRRARFDVLAGTPRPRRRDVLRHLIRLLLRGEG
ncbi:squalene synthase HpnC [Dactylosporangium sp. CA-092794]|uniref:squalene synthase HpnC n=1 Tax=Dactylosporangium sp. CA-092794 TaxID=3239929 RepID=UPI003D94EC16